MKLRTHDRRVKPMGKTLPRHARNDSDCRVATQLAQTPEESWAECERHAKAILEGMPAPPADTPKAKQQEVQTSLFERES